MNTRKIVLMLVALLLSVPKVWQQEASSGQSPDKQAQQKNTTLSEKDQLAAAIQNAQIAKDNQLMNSLVSTNRREGLHAAMEFGMGRRGLIEKLLTILNGTNSISQKLPAVVVLGEYRAPQAAQILAQHLEWDDTVSGMIIGVSQTTIERISLECCPVRIALQEIGEASVPPLLERIVETDDAKITTKCIFICYEIEGQEVTRFRLQGLLAKETDPKKKARIQSALDTLEKIKRGEIRL